MVLALVMCAVLGFFLGTQCRLMPLAATSALIAVVLMVAPSSLGGTVFSGLSILCLIVVLQAFFLAGAGWRVLGPGLRPAPRHEAPQGASAVGGPFTRRDGA